MHDISAYCVCQLKPKKLLLPTVYGCCSLSLFGHAHHLAYSAQRAQHVTLLLLIRQWTMMAAAVSTQGLGGRKRRDDIWVYFKYNPADNKTECIVKEDGDKCGHKVGGKNTTNLKRHLKARHKDIFSKVSYKCC